MSVKIPNLLKCLVVTVFLSYTVTSHAVEDFQVTVTIKPIHSIVSGLMKDISDPILLIEDNQSPYDFKINPQRLKQVENSHLLIWVGPELEQSLQPVISNLPKSVRVQELLSSPRLKILPSRHDDEQRDPFFWMDDRNVIIMLDELTELLIELDPKRSHIYSRNRLEILKPLLRIDKEYEYGYRGLKAGLAVSYFDTLRYFEQAYALKTLGSVTSSPWHNEQASRLLQVRQRIVNQDAACLLLDRSMSSEHLSLLTQGLTINIGELDVLGQQFEAGVGLYLKLMEYNTDVIKRCINADMEQAAQARLSASEEDMPLIDGLGGRFILTDHLGVTVTEQDMKGQYSLIFFGYTHCPDICPTSLMVLTQAFSNMGNSARQIQPYFISVDPARDTVNVLQQYVRYFDERLIGLTGSAAMVKRVADQFKVKYEKVERDDSDSENYIMDHSASLYLMAPDGSFITKFANGITADELAQSLTAIIR